MPDLSLLNEAQLKAVTAGDNPLLVIAGAGSGKTRTIVYRLAHLAENGTDPHSILLLTFTKKAAQEMLHRATQLLGSDLIGVQGGTFHASFRRAGQKRASAFWTAPTARPLSASAGTRKK